MLGVNGHKVDPLKIDKPMMIGAVSVAPRLILAPMSGVTNSAFRRLILRNNPGSVGLVVTEFISVEGLTRRNFKSLGMMHFHAEERPISIQIFGYDIDRMTEAARMVEEAGADIVDINSGCPVPKVVKRGGGCELMRQSEHLGKILTSIRKAVKIPLTLKIRSGWDDSSRNAVEVAKMAEGCGIDALTVHGRTRVQLYRGESDWNLIDTVARSISIPVIGSGDVIDRDSAISRLAHGVSGFMIGRGALENPWVFREVDAGIKGELSIAPTHTAVIDVMEEYLSLLLEMMPERGAIGKMKQFASQVTRKVPGSAPVRKALCRSQSLAEFCELLKLWRVDLQNGTGATFLEDGAQ